MTMTHAGIHVSICDGDNFTAAEMTQIGDALTAVVARAIGRNTGADLTAVNPNGEPAYTPDVDLSILKRLGHVSVVSKYAAHREMIKLLIPAEEAIEGDFVDEEEDNG